MTLSVRAPFTAHVVPLSEVPDPVFASGVVGEGCALVPTAAEDCVTVHSPINGVVTKLKPHAAIVTSTRGVSILVHLGIDTVQLNGRGFLLHATEGDQVAVGTPLISWNPSEVVAGGRSAMCPVVVLDVAPESVTPVEVETVEPGAALFNVQ